MDRYLIALDTETTGVDFNTSQVISCGALFLDDRLNVIHKEEWLVNFKPDLFVWSDESAEIHGINKEIALNHGIEPEVFLKQLEKALIKHYSINSINHIHIIAANAYFDFLMLRNLWNNYRDDQIPFSFRTVDIVSIGFALMGEISTKYITKRLGIEVDVDKNILLYMMLKCILRYIKRCWNLIKNETIVADIFLLFTLSYTSLFQKIGKGKGL